jgi:hypothetical protein
MNLSFDNVKSWEIVDELLARISLCSTLLKRNLSPQADTRLGGVELGDSLRTFSVLMEEMLMLYKGEDTIKSRT